MVTEGEYDMGRVKILFLLLFLVFLVSCGNEAEIETNMSEPMSDFQFANFDSWSFLTGYDFETIQDLSQETFKANLAQGAVGLKSHGVNFYLINPKGVIVKKYNGMNESELELLVKDVKRVK